MQIGRRYRLYPSGEQACILQKWIGSVRHVYNQKIEETEYLLWLRTWSKFSPSYSTPEDDSGIVDQRCAHLKDPTKAWVWETPAILYRNAMSQFRQAWANRFKNASHFGRPQKRAKGVNDSILLTREMFTIENDRLIIKGKKSEPVGSIFFQKHRSCGTPNQITVSHDLDGAWWLSFNFEDGTNEADPIEVLCAADGNPALVEGFDRGVDNAVWRSKLGVIAVPKITRTRLSKWQRRQAGLQQKLSRKTRGSNNRRKVRRQLARTSRKISNTRENFAHQISHRIVTESPARVLVFEDLKLRNMTKAPAPKQDDFGKFVPNGATAKAGLNRALLGNVLGRILILSQYKAVRTGKAVLTVNPAKSSQECSECGYTHPDNRHGGQFHCLRCGSHKHADANASETLENRGVRKIAELLQSVETTDSTPPQTGNQIHA